MHQRSLIGTILGICLEHILFEPVREISNNVVCATSKASVQPAHTRSLIRAYVSPLSIVWLLSYWLNTIKSLEAQKEAAEARPSLHLSKCQIAGNLMPLHATFLGTMRSWNDRFDHFRKPRTCMKTHVFMTWPPDLQYHVNEFVFSAASCLILLLT